MSILSDTGKLTNKAPLPEESTSDIRGKSQRWEEDSTYALLEESALERRKRLR